MKKFNNIEELESLLSESLSSHKVGAPDVWTSVASSTGANASLVAKTISYFSSISNILKVALFAGGIIAATAILFNENSNASKQNNNPVIELNSKEETSKPEETLAESTTKADEPVPKKTANRIDRLKPTLEETAPINNAPKREETENGSPVIVSPDKENDPTKDKGESEAQLLLLPSKKAICLGEKVSISNNLNVTGSWSINDVIKHQNKNQIVLSFNESGVYKVTFKNEGGTETSTLIRVDDLNAKIEVTESLLGNYIFTLNRSDLIANWYLNGALLATNSNNLTHEIEKVGKHEVVAIPVNHKCAAKLSKEIEIKATGSIDFYNVFSPNGDGKNDTYVVNIKDYENFSISIYNNLNNKVFSTQNPGIGWDGTEFNAGLECAAGEYIARISYKLKGEEPKTKNLKLTLIRD